MHAAAVRTREQEQLAETYLRDVKDLEARLSFHEEQNFERELIIVREEKRAIEEALAEAEIKLHDRELELETAERKRKDFSDHLKEMYQRDLDNFESRTKEVNDANAFLKTEVSGLNEEIQRQKQLNDAESSQSREQIQLLREQEHALRLENERLQAEVEQLKMKLEGAMDKLEGRALLETRQSEGMLMEVQQLREQLDLQKPKLARLVELEIEADRQRAQIDSLALNHAADLQRLERLSQAAERMWGALGPNSSVEQAPARSRGLTDERPSRVELSPVGRVELS